jgi:hypothetical protein
MYLQIETLFHATKTGGKTGNQQFLQILAFAQLTHSSSFSNLDVPFLQIAHGPVCRFLLLQGFRVVKQDGWRRLMAMT